MKQGLSAVSAGTVSAAPLSARSLSAKAVTLDQCPVGQYVRICALQAQPRFGDSDAHVSMRLRELGFLPGRSVRVIGYGFLGSDPLAVAINGTKFALRRAEAAKILVEPVECPEVSA